MAHTWTAKDVGRDFYSKETGNIYNIEGITATHVQARVVFTRDEKSIIYVGGPLCWPKENMRWLRDLHKDLQNPRVDTCSALSPE